MLHYGNATVIPGASQRMIEAAFKGCDALWTERQSTQGVTRVIDTTYAMKLHDIDLSFGAITTSRNQVRLENDRGGPNVSVTESFYNQVSGKLQPDGSRTNPEGIAYIALEHRDRIEQRVAWAIIHAAKLCGATPSR